MQPAQRNHKSPATAIFEKLQLRPTRQPMFWAAVFYSVGIIAGVHAGCVTSSWIGLSAAFLAAALYFVCRRAWLSKSLVFGAFLLAGALHIQLRGVSSIRDRSLDELADGQQVTVTAHVSREGRRGEENPNELRQSLDIKTEEITTTDGHRIPVQCGIRLGIYGQLENSSSTRTQAASLIRIFHYGERIRLPVKLRVPGNFRNPGAFDYESYLADNGIAALASAKVEDVEVLPGFGGTPIELLRSRIHSSIVAKVHALWPPQQAALLDAMLIGEDAFLDRDTRVDFQRSGTYHILVVSGMNVTILAFVVFWTLRRLRISEIPATLLTILVCVAYAFVTQVGAPVWRATLMCAIYLATRLFYRQRAMVNALGGAALTVLVFDPRQLFTASFQMTFLCVLIVAAIGIPLIERTSQTYRRALAHWESDDYGPRLLPRVAQFRLDLRLISKRLARFFGEAFSAPGTSDHDRQPRRIRIVVGIGGDADGFGPAHGLLLSPSHHDWPARKHGRRSPHSDAHAVRRFHFMRGIHFCDACEGSRFAHCLRAAGDHRYSAWARRHAAGRSPRGNSISADHCRRFRSTNCRDAMHPQKHAAHVRRDRRDVACILSASVYPSDTTDAPRNSGSELP